MISKELLSEVLGRYVVEFYDESWLKSNNTIVYTLKDEESEDFINIYELANKCKEWALKKGYILHSSLSTFTVMDKQDGISYYGNGFDNEPEAIFKACQWILDNKEIK